MTAKLQEPEHTSASAAWAGLITGSVPGIGILFGLVHKPWTAWLGVLGFAVAICGLLLGIGMQDGVVVVHENFVVTGNNRQCSGMRCPSSISSADISTPPSHSNSPNSNPSSHLYCDASHHLCSCANPQLVFSSSAPESMIMPAPGPSVEAALRVARDFDVSAEQLQRGVDEFLREMSEGLSKTGATLSQIPTFVTSVPNGTEKGLYLAVDLGGTNFRVCSIELRGDSTFNLTQSKVAIPRDLMVAESSKELFKFLAKQIELFLEIHHNEHFEATVRKRRLTGTPDQYRREEIFDLGFTFSFPVHQTSINRGTLIRWTKGFDIPDAIGQDVCLMLQDAINELHLPVRVAALVNDTVGTLMARSYTSPGKTQTLIGAIFGTGTNGAYVEDLGKVTKLKAMGGAEYDTSTQKMVINAEWGSFDNHLSVLPNTVYDEQLDAESNNPGIQMFEKRVSGMFLGEILRLAVLALTKDPEAKLLPQLPSDSPLYQTWGIDTSLLSAIEADTSPDLNRTKTALLEHLKVRNPSTDDALAVRAIGHAIGKRAARLSAVALSAVIIDTKRLDTDETVDVGVDGSLVEFYPNFVDYIREAMREINGIGEREQKIRIGIAKDGSGVGAALIASVAHRSSVSQP